MLEHRVDCVGQIFCHSGVSVLEVSRTDSLCSELLESVAQVVEHLIIATGLLLPFTP